MTNDEAKDLQVRLKASAKRLFPEMPWQCFDELVQEALVSYLEYERRHGKRSKQLCEHAIIEAFRKHYGRSRTSGKAHGRVIVNSVSGTTLQFTRHVERHGLELGESECPLDGLQGAVMSEYQPFIYAKYDLARIEKEYLLACLKHFEGNKTRTAKFLKISLKGLRNKVNAIKMELLESGGDERPR